MYSKAENNVTNWPINQSTKGTLLKSVFLFCLLVLSSTCGACDLNAFVQDDFSARFQKMLDNAQKLQVANMVNHPDKSSIAGALNRQWVEFYLAHGMNDSGIPPAYGFIATATWLQTMKLNGQRIADLSRQQLDATEHEVLYLQLSLLIDPAQHKAAVEMFKAWETILDSEERSDNWLEKVAVEPFEYLQNFTLYLDNLNIRLLNETDFMQKEIIRLRSSRDQYDDYVFSALTEMIKMQASETLQFWREAFLAL